jgi:hypothetical protein
MALPYKFGIYTTQKILLLARLVRRFNLTTQQACVTSKVRSKVVSTHWTFHECCADKKWRREK